MDYGPQKDYKLGLPAKLCGWEQRQNGSFHLWINVWVAGKTMISR